MNLKSSPSELSKEGKHALARINRLRAHLAKIDGLFKGFKKNLDQAFKLNSQLITDLKNVENAKSHEKWLTIGNSIATVGLLITSWMIPNLAPISVPLALGSSMGVGTHILAA